MFCLSNSHTVYEDFIEINFYEKLHKQEKQEEDKMQNIDVAMNFYGLRSVPAI